MTSVSVLLETRNILHRQLNILVNERSKLNRPDWNGVLLETTCERRRDYRGH